MANDFLTCPFCQAKMHPDGTEHLPGDSVVECTKCRNQFTLDNARPTRLVRASGLPSRPRRPAGGQVTASHDPWNSISVHTADIPYRQTLATQVIVRNDNNTLGTAAFVTSIVALFTGGCLSPIALIFSVIAMQRPPKGMAAAGLVISLVGLIPAFLLTMVVVLPMLAVGGAAASQAARGKPFVNQEHATAQAPEPEETKAAAPEKKTLTAQLFGVKQIDRATGDRSDIEFQLKNTSDQPISRIKVQIQFIESANQVLAEDAFTARVPEPIRPGETRRLLLTPSYKSPLRSKMPSSARGTATLVSAE